MIGCIGVMRDCSQVREANDAADRDEETNEECRNDPKFLSLVPDLELRELRDR